MHNAHPTVLGISPGTKSIGLAIYRNRGLVEWRVRTFKGSWSNDKLKDILFFLKNYIDDHQVTVLVIKKPGTISNSEGLLQIVSEITVLAKRRKIEVAKYSLQEMKRYYSQEKEFSKAEMIRQLASVNAGLHHEYNKEQRNRHSYYIKMFEAIILAQIKNKY